MVSLWPPTVASSTPGHSGKGGTQELSRRAREVEGADTQTDTQTQGVRDPKPRGTGTAGPEPDSRAQGHSTRQGRTLHPPPCPRATSTFPLQTLSGVPRAGPSLAHRSLSNDAGAGQPQPAALCSAPSSSSWLWPRETPSKPKGHWHHCGDEASHPPPRLGLSGCTEQGPGLGWAGGAAHFSQHPKGGVGRGGAKHAQVRGQLRGQRWSQAGHRLSGPRPPGTC